MPIMLTRLRHGIGLLSAGSAMLLAVVMLLAPAVEASQSADQYLKQFGEDALGQLTEEGLSDEERQARFAALLEQGFDVPAIGQFVVARYWRAASEQERSEFLEVFRHYLTQRFLPLFQGYTGGGLHTQAAKPTDREGMVWVPLRLDREGGEAVRTEWLLRETDSGGYKILDIKAEGTSMAITLRDEYASVIRREGSLAALTEEIRRLLEQGAFAPRT